MGIVSSSLTARTGISGRRRIEEVHTDHLGEEHVYEYLTTSPFDPELDLPVHATQVEKFLAGAENESFRGGITAAFDFDAWVPTHTTKKNAVKYALRWGMRQQDANDALKVLPLVTWLKANYSGQTLADYLGVSLAKLQAVNTRYTALAAMAPDLEIDEGYAQDLDVV